MYSLSNKISKNLKLIGGRYCSVQGVIAAQLHLLDSQTNLRYTLYQFKISDKTEDLKNTVNKSKEVQVKLWREGNIGFALANDINSL